MNNRNDVVPSWNTDPYVIPYPETAQFWEAAASGRFILPRCQACGKHHWYPRAMCPHCGSDKLEWVNASGNGAVYSYSVARTFENPHVVAFVRIDEGPVLLTNIVDCDVDSVRIGQYVRVKFRPTLDGRCMPVFAPR